MREAIQMWWECVRSIDVKYAWKRTMIRAFPASGIFVLQLILSPISIPLFFVLLCYQQYAVNKLIFTLHAMIVLLKKVLPPVEKPND